jgi:hypothetical protein
MKFNLLKGISKNSVLLRANPVLKGPGESKRGKTPIIGGPIKCS